MIKTKKGARAPGALALREADAVVPPVIDGMNGSKAMSATKSVPLQREHRSRT
jgi:hypothetical protein